ncbi:hypothetical protein FRACYDRAFT_266977 [Fragilariopsis cylindrus CCMP1102]|uniref:Uncharacterized protein n=1 Tax=Fragilariopsis cylindrus CCMP1102 TaxID=635003 RepID=A0A1E7EIP3_9STRA|nr:hypothetical protein FRACYDRAFT_266977 [Fragilariopsis cylindrus CCMP1102]|eukprot:OEU05740.1 hypothetical protein FRACYDRAFT_266977 [Fragilariopsis cylindrus CCMP1102]
MSGITTNNSGGNSSSNSNSNPTPTPTTLRAVQAAYIPPHLRHKKNNHCDGSSSNTSNGTNNEKNINSRRGIGGGGNGGNGGGTTTSRQQQQQQQQHRPSTTISSSISSRWSNLDNDHNNDHNNRGGGHGHGHGQRSSYNNNRRISGSYNNTNTNNTTDNIQAIFFGDSFIKLFGLLNDFYDKQSLRRNSSNHVIEVHKYKAASAKGLTKSQNENSIHILKTISRINDKLYPKLERLVFCFGSVDVHMSYYYKKYVQNDLNFNLDSLKQIAIDYIDFVVSLPIINNNNTNNNAVLKILIIGIYPSPLLDSNVGASLKAYGSLETQQQVEAVNQSTDCVMYNRLQRVLIFNNTLKERCHYYNNNLDEIIETNKKTNDDQDNNNQDTDQDQDQVTTTSTTTTPTSTLTTTLSMLSSSYTYTIKDIYRDVSDLNIHLIHETLLQLWITKWSWYQDLTTLTTTTTRENDDDDIGEGEVRNSSSSSSSSSRDRSKEDRKELSVLSFVEYLQETFIEYRKTKPWAKRKSIIEIDGIH